VQEAFQRARALHAVTNDIAEGWLVEPSVEDVPAGGLALPMFAIYPDAEPPGPAGRWMIQAPEELPGKAHGGKAY